MSPVLVMAGAFLAGAGVTFVVTPIVARLAISLGIVDRPDERKLHKKPTPRMGGLAVFAGLVAGSLAYGFIRGWGSHFKLFSKEAHLPVLMPCVIVFVIGMADDVRGLGPKVRIVVEGVAAVLLMRAGFLIDSIWIPFGPPIQLWYFAYPVTLLWFIGVTNAFNLTDGLDGLLSSVGIASLIGCAAVGLSVGMVGTPALALALAGALAGFLPWNWHGARVFLGDSGSLLVGFVVAALSIKVSRYGSGGIGFHVLLPLCAIPVIETFLTLARRYVSNRPFFSPDRSHVHHVLVNRKGLAVTRAVVMLGGAQALLSGMAVFSRVRLGWYSLIPNAVLLAFVTIWIWWLGYIELSVIWRHLLDRLLLYRRRRHLCALAEIARGGELVRGANSAAELKDRLRDSVTEGRFAYLALELSESGAQILAAEPAVAESRNAEAAAYLASQDGRLGWLFSAEAADTDDQGQAHPTGVTFAVRLLVDDGCYGRLVCHRCDDPRDLGLAARDVQRYLAGPLVEVMGRLRQPPEERIYMPKGTGQLQPAWRSGGPMQSSSRRSHSLAPGT